jgi:hypothetical protein
MKEEKNPLAHSLSEPIGVVVLVIIALTTCARDSRVASMRPAPSGAPEACPVRQGDRPADAQPVCQGNTCALLEQLL